MWASKTDWAVWLSIFAAAVVCVWECVKFVVSHLAIGWR
jgi:hypothetical protein